MKVKDKPNSINALIRARVICPGDDQQELRETIAKHISEAEAEMGELWRHDYQRLCAAAKKVGFAIFVDGEGNYEFEKLEKSGG